MPMKKHLTAVVAMGLAANFAMADTYQTELKLDYGRAEQDNNIYKADLGTATGKLYFSEVELKNFVYGEAAFLNRSSNISVSYTRDEYKTDDAFPNSNDRYYTKATERITSANVEFYIPNTFLYLAGGISDAKTKIRGWERHDGVETRIREDISPSSYWHASLGITPVEGLLIATDFYEDHDLDDLWTLRAKYVADLGGKAINVEAGYENFYGDDIVNAAVDYYFTRSFSLGATYQYYENDLFDDVWGVRARQFFGNHFSIDASYAKYDDGDHYGVGVAVRF